jgi:hypothetical protein
MKQKFKSHAAANNNSNSGEQALAPALTPRFNPNAPGALVVFRAPSTHDASGRPLVDVVVDPHLSRYTPCSVNILLSLQ